MTQVNKIDSNVTALAYAEEAILGVLPGEQGQPGTPTWEVLEPNSYADFGGQITTVARNPIDKGRQRKKGVTTDLDASGGINSDLTQTNLQDLLQGFFFADLRRKGEEPVTSVTVDYLVADTTGFQVNDLVLASGFGEAANNGLKLVDTVVSNTSISVVQTLAAEASPPTGAGLVVVGHQAAAGDIDVDASGPLPKLTSTTLSFASLGLTSGEWIFIGGDLAIEQFTNAENNGFARVRSTDVNELVLDKTQLTMVTEASATETIRLFFGRVLKNEVGALIKRRSYNLERQLGAPDAAFPTQVQAEYLIGSVANQMTLNVATSDKLTADISFVSIDTTYIDGPTALKTGDRPALVETDAFNTSSDFVRLKLADVSSVDANVTPLFAFATEVSLEVNNNVTPDKAVTKLGAFDVTAGQFIVTGTLTVYFGNVAAIQAVRNNADITLDMIAVKSNSGIAWDIPLITLGDGRLNVEQDQPITLPLSTDAASGAKVDVKLDHTLLMVFFDYLPNLADSQ